jgi:hypothetical protein
MTTTLNASTAGAGGFIATGDNSGSLALQTAGTTAVTVTSGQNVGIGTASPVEKVEIANGALAFSGTATFNGSGEGIYHYGANGLGFVTGGSNRLIIDSNGRVGINGSSLDSSWLSITGNVSNPTLESYQNTTSLCSHLWFRNPNGIVGSITLSGSSTAYNTSSDYRLKENIAPMTGALAKIAQLKPVTFKWKVDGSDCEGFIAHELQEVKPDCVSGAKDAVDEHGNPIYQGIDTSFLVATLTAAIQELSAKNDALTARLVALESK